MTIRPALSGPMKAPNEKSDWTSITIGSLICFLTAVQFSIYFSSLWPYFQEMDSTATETFFGYITAIYSLGQGLASPVFGYWCNRIDQTKIPTLVGLIIMSLGNIFYMMIPFRLLPVKYMMMLSRGTMGIGGGIIGVLRTAAVTASTQADRSRVMSITNGAFALGLTIGPAIQFLFNPLGYPGITIAEPLRINIYSSPAISGFLTNIVCMILVVFVYKDSRVGIYTIEEMDNEDHKRFFALPKYDKLAASICILTRFAQMFVVAILETISSPFAMIMFNWSRETTVYWMAIFHLAFGLFGFTLYAINVIFDLAKKMNQRVCCVIGCALLVLFHLITFPWPFLTAKIHYQDESLALNGSEPTGCRRSFEWCADVPAISPYVYAISYSVLISAGFALTTVAMSTTFSTVIGPRNQGTMQGLMMFAGSVARLLGPIIISTLFTAFGPRLPWILEMIVAGGTGLLWIVFYQRLVPLKLDSNLRAGDSFKNKFGMVYKF